MRWGGVAGEAGGRCGGDGGGAGGGRLWITCALALRYRLSFVTPCAPSSSSSQKTN